MLRAGDFLLTDSGFLLQVHGADSLPFPADTYPVISIVAVRTGRTSCTAFARVPAVLWILSTGFTLVPAFVLLPSLTLFLVFCATLVLPGVFLGLCSATSVLDNVRVFCDEDVKVSAFQGRGTIAKCKKHTCF